MFFSFEFEMILSILQEMCRGKLILLILDLFCCLLPCGLKARRDDCMHQTHDQDQLFLDFPSFIQVRSIVKKLSNQMAAVSLDGHVLAFLDDFSLSALRMLLDLIVQLAVETAPPHKQDI